MGWAAQKAYANDKAPSTGSGTPVGTSLIAAPSVAKRSAASVEALVLTRNSLGPVIAGLTFAQRVRKVRVKVEATSAEL